LDIAIRIGQIHSRRNISLSGEVYTIVGVMPSSFRFPVDQSQNAFWTTLALDDDPSDLHPAVTNRGGHFLAVFGRLKPGVSVAQADQDLNTMPHAWRSSIRTQTQSTIR